MENVETDLSVLDELSALAQFIDSHQPQIFDAWRNAVENDPRLKTASRLTRREFEDNITATLEVLTERLRQGSPLDFEAPNSRQDAGSKESRQHAAEHGLHRWQEGYDLQELVLEWGHLGMCLIHLLNEYEAAQPTLQRRTINLARVLVGQISNGGFAESTSAYFQLQQAEAKEIVRELTLALREVQDWKHARGQFLREAVHDLRGHLSPVLAASELLLSKGGEMSETTRDGILDFLRRSTNAHHQMLTDLLDLARLEAGEEALVLEPLDVTKLLQDVCSSLSPQAISKGLYLNFSGPEYMPCEADSLKLRRVAQNLILNAIKYTGEGGVSVRWSEVEDEQWSLSVSDTGPGLASGLPDNSTAYLLPESTENGDASAFIQGLKQDPEKTGETGIFQKTDVDPQARNAASGEGVGLVIVKRLCIVLEGKLRVESRIGEGTSFNITFPKSY